MIDHFLDSRAKFSFWNILTFKAVSESQAGVAKLLKEPPEPAPQYIKAFDQWVSLKCWLDELAVDIFSKVSFVKMKNNNFNLIFCNWIPETNFQVSILAQGTRTFNIADKNFLLKTLVHNSLCLIVNNHCHTTLTFYGF